MIYLFEQYGYKRTGFYEGLNAEQLARLEVLKEGGFVRTVKRKGKQAMCVKVDFDRRKGMFHFETSYFVGVDWLVEKSQALYVQPKLNKEGREVDYLGMLFEALQEPENLRHLEGLVTVDFDRTPVVLDQKFEDILSPFLLVEFLQVLKRIVQKGMKRAYYPLTENLEGRVKGKVLVASTLKRNVMQGKLTRTMCGYGYFGRDCEENRILKKAFLFTCRASERYLNFEKERIGDLTRFIRPAFDGVTDEVSPEKWKGFRVNPVYQEYGQALKLALLILKCFSYNISRTVERKVATPPFWIDMSKLFELYVYKKLREVFPGSGEVSYHVKSNGQELDFLLNGHGVDGQNLKLVIDAKYKPRYDDEEVLTSDARQLCGYSRLGDIYKILNVDRREVIPCVIVFSSQKCTDTDFTADAFTPVEEGKYTFFHKVGIRLPEIKAKEEDAAEIAMSREGEGML